MPTCDKRWMCWPDPDQACLEGGCGYCMPDPSESSDLRRRSHKRWTRVQVRRYADRAGYPLSDYWLENGMRNRAVR
jgi:hypothetical protein